MTKEDLNKIIEQLEKQSSKDKATFGLYFEDNEDEMHIKANKDGFELFACELLKASRDSEDVIQNQEKNYIDIGFNEKWIEGELISYIKPISESRTDKITDKRYKESFKDTVFKYGCLVIIGIIIFSLIIGIYTVFSWFL